jgi:hypothetical protein
MKNTILICGLIRQENILKEMIDIYCRLRSENIIYEIIIATDKNTYNNNIMKEYFKEKKIIYKEYNNLSLEDIKRIDPDVENKELCKLRKKNNSITIWKELFNIKQALLDIYDNRYILKTRTDLYLSYELVKKIFTDYKILLKNDILDYKIWGSAFNYKEILYIIDFAFSGSKNDLIKACHSNSESFSWNPNNKYGFNASDTIWWTYIFNNKFPIVKQFIETYRNFEKPIIQTYDEELYIESIATWIHILESYFVIDNLQKKDFVFFPSWGGNWVIDNTRFQNKNWLNKFKNGDYNNDYIINQIYNKYLELY